ncbi:glycoside hydrolase like protein [Dothistroma septosporum NZE10]|uniref:Glycoside hydrolase like protein n=1 Tax=Dothistroma septosporum (strain NZE10 / CBS 128990) TaxID=675120 RepID=M2WL85_DOTSN|nr:glycoside hydrolase like protein [Dothistroma septosporum NZE10]
MQLNNVLSVAALLAGYASAQSSVNPTSTYYAPGIPTDAPVPGNYTGYLRPRVHYSPPRYFMNDPNGLHKGADGTWHLYYQYNPLTPVAGNQHWGHATSRDLYTWENQKIAIFPPNNYTFVFSGSAVVDSNNTSGFFPNQTNGVVAIYTLAEYPGGVQGTQYQAIAYSRDDGYTFEAYEGNPVLDINSTNFRDPYVVWDAAYTQWIMTVSYAAVFTLGIYTSPDLRNWTHASNLTKHGYLGVQYECPNLLQLPMEGQDEPVWVLFLSLNPGGPRGGSVTQYFAGDWNGTHFTPYDAGTRLTDFGKDNYAAQFFNGIARNEPQVSMGWASNWQYAQIVPTGLIENEQFRSALTVPRAHHLANISARGYDLISEIHNISAVLDKEVAYETNLGNGTVLANFDSATVESGAIYFEANITGLTGSTLQGIANFTIYSSVSGEYIRGGINAAGWPGIWIDHSNIRGFDNPYFNDKFSEEGLFTPAMNPVTGLAKSNGSFNLGVIVDHSILEVYLNGGQAAGTSSFFPMAELDTLAIRFGNIPGNASTTVGVWGLKDPWAEQANANGTVVGNTTQTMGSMRMF